MDMLKNMAIEAAVLAGGYSDKFKDIGNQIATALANGMTAADVVDIKGQMETLYSGAQETISTITSMFDGMDTASAEAQQKIVDDAKAAQDALQAKYSATGKTITDSFTKALEDGTSEADFTKSIGAMLKNMAIEAAVLAGGFAEKFKDIGKQIAEGLSAGLSAENMTSIKDQISTLYTQAQGTVTGINTVFSGIEGFADGTLSAPGGLAIVGERGPELMNVPRGAQIYPSEQTSNILRGDFSQSGRAPINVTIQSTRPLDPIEVGAQVKRTMESLAFQGVV
jgi:phage-related tail protein